MSLEVSNSIQSVKKHLEELRVALKLANESIEDFSRKIEKHELYLQELENAQILFQAAIKAMYSSLSSKLGDIVTQGIAIVFPDSNYIFCVEFEEKRNTIEAHLFFRNEDDRELNPLNEVGGGIVDFTSILLRIVYILLSPNQNILIADEPLKFISRDRMPEAVQFLKELCKKLDFKIVVTTHIQELISNADTIYSVKKIKNVSVVKKVDK